MTILVRPLSFVGFASYQLFARLQHHCIWFRGWGTLMNLLETCRYLKSVPRSSIWIWEALVHPNPMAQGSLSSLTQTVTEKNHHCHTSILSPEKQKLHFSFPPQSATDTSAAEKLRNLGHCSCVAASLRRHARHCLLRTISGVATGKGNHWNSFAGKVLQNAINSLKYYKHP